MENYFNKLMEDGYDTFSRRIIKWPDGLDLSDKLHLLEVVRDYFNSIEDYNKCVVLTKKIKSITRQKNKKTK